MEGPQWLSRRGVLSTFMGVAAFSAASVADSVATLRFGLTPVFLDNDWQLLERMGAHIRQATGRDVDFIQRRTYKEVVALLLLGEIDAAWLCGYPLLQHPGRLEAMAIPVWQGQPLYRAYLIVPNDRQADDLLGLQGDVHAYSDPDSNSGHLVTVARLLELGQRPESFFSRSFFTFGHRNVVRAVARRLAQSGSVDGYVYDALASTEPDLVARTRVVWRSDWHAFPPVVVASEAQASPAEFALSQALFDIARTEAGREVLRMLQLDGFVRPEADSFDSIARLMHLVSERG
ncbi:MAG: PhnD/SsuA/transferrin family substrate-binding protein [Pararhodobacter sp.]